MGINGGVTMFSTVTENEFYVDNIEDRISQKGLDPYCYHWTAGLAYKYFSERIVGLALEFNYIKKGGYNVFIFDYEDNPIDTTAVFFRHDLEYIEFPFMMNIRFGKRNLKNQFLE